MNKETWHNWHGSQYHFYYILVSAGAMNKIDFSHAVHCTLYVNHSLSIDIYKLLPLVLFVCSISSVKGLIYESDESDRRYISWHYLSHLSFNWIASWLLSISAILWLIHHLVALIQIKFKFYLWTNGIEYKVGW